MTVQLDVLRGSESLPLFGGSPFWFLTMTGLGLPPIRRIKERSPQQNGSTDVGYLLDERYLNIALLAECETDALADEARDTLAEMLKPLETTPLNVRVTRDDGQIRQIDGHVNGIVDFPLTFKERQGPTQLVVIQLECANPLPYDPALQNISFSLTAGVSSLSIPLLVPMTMAATGGLDQIETVNYVGSVEEKPVIYITGPVTDLVITNETTGYVLDFTGHTIAGGDTYTVNLATKRILDQNGTRKLSALTDASNLFKWALASTPAAVGGVNSIHVEVASGVTAASAVRFEYYNRYASF